MEPCFIEGVLRKRQRKDGIQSCKVMGCCTEGSSEEEGEEKPRPQAEMWLFFLPAFSTGACLVTGN